MTISPGFVAPIDKEKPYQMPFLMDVDAFARRAADAISAGVRYRTIPWQRAGLARC